jgi:hypothetical protein
MKIDKKISEDHAMLVKNLVSLLEKGNAHVSLDRTLQGIPLASLGETPPRLPYSIWQIAEHVRIAQWDLLEFSRNEKHISPQWPEGYWPKEAAPLNEDAWEQCVSQIKADRASFIALIKQAGVALYQPFKHGDGQSLLKEVLVLADHNSYHAGEIVIIRRLFNIWP